MTTTTDQKKSKITTPDRLQRIFAKMCAAKMNVLIRTDEDNNTGIRGAFHLLDEGTSGTQIFLSGISQKGREKLEFVKNVRIEVLGMPTRVMFHAFITRHYAEGIGFLMPSELVSEERRLNTRYQTLPKHMAYIALSSWQANEDDWAAPPVIPLFQSASAWLPLADISMGGMCVLTQFPSVLNQIEINAVDNDARLIFPMIDPVAVKIQFRWQKRTINRVILDGEEHSQKQFRFGLEFVDADEDLKMKIRQFLRQLSMADAI